MPTITDIEPLLTAPAEVLDVEYKSWLDLRGNDEHKGLLAKAAIAIANEGGGNIVLGMREDRPKLISEPCPAEIAAYDQDLINQIIRRFASPAFHCTLTMLRNPETGHEHAVVGVPGGFNFPVMSKSGTAGNTIRPHVPYMRKPGPESAPPENQGDWERLLGKCLRNRREDMLDAIRAIVEGKAQPAAPPVPSDAERQEAFAEGARARWSTLTGALKPDAPQRCPLGRYELDYILPWRILDRKSLTIAIGKRTSGCEQIDDVLDGCVGAVIGGFELAGRPMMVGGAVVEAAVGEWAAEPLVEEEE
jgi:hypothetical protein